MSQHINGLVIDRVFSEKGPSPLDSVKWTSRDAGITNPKGEHVFLQRGVEVPENWSRLATNIVASKYFYGDMANLGKDPDSGGREFSVRQLIHRVTKTIMQKGLGQGYFASIQDAQTFYDELTWLCVNQYGCFNSPVWFNVGLNHIYGVIDSGNRRVWGWSHDQQKIVDVDPYEHPQASACFIIAVEDSIDDIWRLMGESARLFKYGSGVGADWSTLRSTVEKLSGGGVPSGPVSFMRVQDTTGGTIKSGGKTRRAAIMQTLKIWHPDILDFIECKRKEEEKAWALIEQGYDGSFNGEAYGSVAFQNVNQSVRVTDEFMDAAVNDMDFMLKKVSDQSSAGTVDASSLLHQIAKGTHLCGDPGVQYEDTIQSWHTCPISGPITSSNPCSEYMFLDNSACNLASLNLCKFLSDEGVIQTSRLKAATRVFITAMEILVDNAGYPSAKIAQNSHDYRPLGLGFANLGALLMAKGLPYDSNKGRGVASGLMSLIHSEAYRRSAEIASNPEIGPFKGYEANREPMIAVIEKHVNETLKSAPDIPDEMREDCTSSAYAMLDAGKEYGYRNSQVTVLAPTGTIAFMMDCDTTGIEPDIALVKYKLLAGKGDGMLKIVNQSVGRALDALGYSEEDVLNIIEHIDEHDTIEGAPQLKEEHLPVFDCAFKPMNGERSVSHMGHVGMMAACQPFISGAISKTVNVPEDASVGDIADIYVEGWKRGLKALAVYRENSKRSQPLSTSKDGNTQESSGDGIVKPVEIKNEVTYKPVRNRLPADRMSIAHRFAVAGHKGYLHVGLYPKTNQPGEIFLRMAKEGSTLSGLLEAFAIAVSMALQNGVPLEDLVVKFRHMRFEPAGFTQNKDIPQATSIIDYVFAYLENTFITQSSVPDIKKWSEMLQD